MLGQLTEQQEKEWVKKAQGDKGENWYHFFKNMPNEAKNNPSVILACLQDNGRHAYSITAMLASAGNNLGGNYGPELKAPLHDVRVMLEAMKNDSRSLDHSRVSSKDWANVAEAYTNMEHIFKARSEAANRPADSKIGMPQYEGELYATGKGPGIGG